MRRDPSIGCLRVLKPGEKRVLVAPQARERAVVGRHGQRTALAASSEKIPRITDPLLIRGTEFSRG